MSNQTKGTPLGGTVTKGAKPLARTSGRLAFSLVVIMLGILFFLIVALLIFAGTHSNDTTSIDYSKWALTTLLGTFGAWIGAGAAYFFGQENLAQSSAPTQAALNIQQQTMRGVPRLELIRELALTAMNKEFMFNPNNSKKDVTDKLTNYTDYWWVPVLDKDGKGVLEDIIHARVFWDTTSTNFKDSEKISKIVSDIDTLPEFKKKFGKFHGASFFVKAAPDDKITDITDNMNKSGASVGVIVDEKGKPTYCFTKQYLLNVQN
jgi:hypothetical protein